MKKLLMIASVMASFMLAQTTIAQTKDEAPAKPRAEAMKEKMKARADERFNEVDQDKNSLISRQEYLKKANERFDVVDENKDQSLSKEELAKKAKEKHAKMREHRMKMQRYRHHQRFHQGKPSAKPEEAAPAPQN